MSPGNPMDPYLSSPQMSVPGYPATSQPYGRIDRPAMFHKYFTVRHHFEPLASGARGARDAVQIDGDADFHIQAISLLADNRGAKLRLEVTPASESLNFVPSFLSHFGSGPFPFPLPHRFRLSRNTIFSAVMDDRQLVPGNNNIILAYHGAKVYRSPIRAPRRYVQIKSFGYVINFTADDGGPGALAAASTGILNLRTDQDSDFEVCAMTLTSDAPFTFQVNTDADNWFGAQLNADLFGGQRVELTNKLFSGERPFLLPAPRVVTGAGYISVTATNLDAANANRVQIGFWGNRLYPAGGTNGRVYPVGTDFSQGV